MEQEINMKQHSAEWLRGAVAALDELSGVVLFIQIPEIREALASWIDRSTSNYRQLLAAAESRDDNPTIDEHINAAVNDLYRKYGPRLDLFFADVEAHKPATLEAKNER